MTVDPFELALLAHVGQKRKGFDCPFIAHPMSVAANVMEYTGAQYVDPAVQAAFLHDVLEDTTVSERAISSRYGYLVLEIVKAVTHDPDLSGKPKRLAYVQKMQDTPLIEAVIVSACDKLDNLRSIRHNQYNDTADEFKPNMWFYEELLKVYRKRLTEYPDLVRAVQDAYETVMMGYYE